MSTITKQAPSKAALLEPLDIAMLKQRETLKVKLRRLDLHLRPRISATIDERGAGKVMVGSHLVELRRSVRQCVAWKPLAYSQLDEAIINEVVESFTEPTNIDSARIAS